MDYLIKASAVVALFYICFFLLLKRETFFQHNRLFLLTGIVISLIFPMVIIPIEIIVEPAPTQELFYTIQDTGPITNSNAVVKEPFDWLTLASIIYGIGLTFFLIQFLFQFGSLILLLVKNPKNKDGFYTYVTVKNSISPFSFFKWIVYNPDTYNKDELDLILTHEKVHVNQLHSIDIILSQLTCIVFWINPLIWLYRKEIRQNLEYIADAKTQHISNSEKEYQHLLLKTSVGNQNIPLSNNLYNSLIKERIVMLQKSKSQQKKQWRYLLILPLLAGLLISMNTEKVYVEAESNPINSIESTIDFVVSKLTTDAELKKMSDLVESKGGSLVFSQIKRNSNNELTGILVKLNDHSYGGDFGQPIDSFIIYKEFFGRGGGYVGRINAATLHFDDDTNHQESIDALVERASKVILKNNVQQIITPLETKKTDQKYIEVTFNKDMTDKELDDIKEELKSNDVNMTIKQLKRNNKNEITDISVDFSSNGNSANYGISGSEPIKPFYFKMDKNSFGVGGLEDEEIIIVEEIIVDSLNHKSVSKPKTFIFRNENNKAYAVDSTQAKQYNDQRTIVIDRIKNKIKNHDTIYYNTLDSAEIKKLTKLKSNIYYESNKPVKIITEHQTLHEPGINENTIIKIRTISDDPVYIINGKAIEKEHIKDIEPNAIHQIHVIKGEEAINKYGAKGKNGVVVIDLKKDNTWTTKSDTKKSDGPWSMSVSSSYVDEENPSKNGTLVYITKKSEDFVLDHQKAELKKIGINVKYSKVKRNNLNEITRIKIALTDKNGKETISTYKNDDGIATIEFGVANGNLIIRTSSPEMQKIMSED
ncbi:M56 family metallopeptidase [Winogradskyella ursingii]|uniref:M56 family metallopeptidase n=1 Tax=Winogradskyella ursingii TaxID=2686079 RepID=UPI0015C82CC1|nr:M56 family metallopeptidase [Winogradskyella ursingii]